MPPVRPTCASVAFSVPFSATTRMRYFCRCDLTWAVVSRETPIRSRMTAGLAARQGSEECNGKGWLAQCMMCRRWVSVDWINSARPAPGLALPTRALRSSGGDAGLPRGFTPARRGGAHRRVRRLATPPRPQKPRAVRCPSAHTAWRGQRRRRLQHGGERGMRRGAALSGAFSRRAMLQTGWWDGQQAICQARRCSPHDADRRCCRPAPRTYQCLADIARLLGRHGRGYQPSRGVCGVLVGGACAAGLLCLPTGS